MATQEEINAAEALAAHKALEVFTEVLGQELEKLGCTTIMQALGRTEHVHYALLTGDETGVVRHTFVFDDSPQAVAAVLRTQMSERTRLPLKVKS
jgi:hypothetical protein